VPTLKTPFVGPILIVFGLAYFVVASTMEFSKPRHRPMAYAAGTLILVLGIGGVVAGRPRSRSEDDRSS
jgi:hypothetical protein